ASAVARPVVRERPFRSTDGLAATVARAVGRTTPGLHPATRTFQAIRILVNAELGELERLLAVGWGLLPPGGRLAVLASYSREDRRVKDALRRWAASCLCPPGLPRCACGWSAKVCVLTSRAQTPAAAEVSTHARAR